jgi:hypothetical protein
VDDFEIDRMLITIRGRRTREMPPARSRNRMEVSFIADLSLKDNLFIHSCFLE